jgi:nucleotide-binding universal stress UspA family protein
MASQGPVLIAYDGSDGAKQAIAEAGKLLGGRKALVVSVWQSMASAAAASAIAIPTGVAHHAYEEIDRDAERQASEQAGEGAELANEAGFDAEARVAMCDLNTWSTIVTIAEDEDVAAVVIGSRGRSGIKSALLGSVSHGVAQHSRRPVLVVRTAGHDATQ